MKRLALLLFGLLFLTGCSAPHAGAIGYRQITPQEALDMMAREQGYIILDVRTDSEFKAGHIPGAVNYPNEAISTADIPELPDKQQLILVYCRSGNRSKQASAKLAKLGYTNVIEFGGINAWSGEITAD